MFAICSDKLVFPVSCSKCGQCVPAFPLTLLKSFVGAVSGSTWGCGVEEDGEEDGEEIGEKDAEEDGAEIREEDGDEIGEENREEIGEENG